MSSLNEIYIKKSTLQELLTTCGSEKGLKVTISLGDKADNYGNNVSAYIAQSKEAREAKEKKTYVGNGRTFYTRGETPIPAKVERSSASSSAAPDDSLPY